MTSKRQVETGVNRSNSTVSDWSLFSQKKKVMTLFNNLLTTAELEPQAHLVSQFRWWEKTHLIYTKNSNG